MLLIGGGAGVVYRRAAEHADGWTMGGGKPDMFAEAVDLPAGAAGLWVAARAAAATPCLRRGSGARYRRPMPSDRAYSRLSTSMPAGVLRAVGKLNVPLYRLSRGRIGGKMGRAPVLLLETTGRKSGQARVAPVLYLDDDGRLVVIGSNAGNVGAPAWALNLVANPDAAVEVRGKRRPVRARVAEGAEREDLWGKMNAQYSGFDHYKERTDRDIKVFVLEGQG